MSKETGGRGVQRLREFNIALFGKWCWRALEERKSLWYQVLGVRYGEERGRLSYRGRRRFCVVEEF